MSDKPFSEQIKSWLHSSDPKTLGNLAEVFGKSSFATVFIIGMALPATPLPTGGITHVIEILVMLLALETIIGLEQIWLPKSMADRKLPAVVTEKGLPKFIRFLKWLEKHSRVRGAKFLNNTWIERFSGIAVFAFALGAMLAIPFSNLDTIASVGAVLLSLGLVLNDIAYYIAGLLIGIAGLVIEITLGAVIARYLNRLWDNVSIEVRLIGLAVILLAILVLIIRHRKKR